MNQKASLWEVRLDEDIHLGYFQTSEVQLTTVTNNTILFVTLLRFCNWYRPLRDIFIFEPENKIGEQCWSYYKKYKTLGSQRQNLQLNLKPNQWLYLV